MRGAGARTGPSRKSRSAGAPRASGRRRRAVVDVDEAQVVARDPVHGRVAVEAVRVGGVCLHGLAEDRPADREADVTVEAGAGAQPLVDLLVGCAAAEDDARHAVATLAADELRDLPARLALVDALDLPDVGLDAAVLQLEDRLHHQLRPQLGVVALLAAADRL